MSKATQIEAHNKIQGPPGLDIKDKEGQYHRCSPDSVPFLTHSKLDPP